jgi:hypothetical protein
MYHFALRENTVDHTVDVIVVAPEPQTPWLQAVATYQNLDAAYRMIDFCMLYITDDKAFRVVIRKMFGK